MEIIITAILIIASVYIIFKNIKKSSKGDCNCGNCSSSCPKYKK
ncbi:FeoB-associated Cys-rich membrane protein [uncultured Clostridium sp.]|nr:FeoB-associated Cys-rich membrane protein [uncultured Clostridium sp.]